MTSILNLADVYESLPSGYSEIMRVIKNIIQTYEKVEIEKKIESELMTMTIGLFTELGYEKNGCNRSFYLKSLVEKTMIGIRNIELSIKKTHRYISSIALVGSSSLVERFGYIDDIDVIPTGLRKWIENQYIDSSLDTNKLRMSDAICLIVSKGLLHEFLDILHEETLFSYISFGNSDLLRKIRSTVMDCIFEKLCASINSSKTTDIDGYFFDNTWYFDVYTPFVCDPRTLTGQIYRGYINYYIESKKIYNGSAKFDFLIIQDIHEIDRRFVLELAAIFDSLSDHASLCSNQCIRFLRLAQMPDGTSLDWFRYQAGSVIEVINSQLIRNGKYSQLKIGEIIVDIQKSGTVINENFPVEVDLINKYLKKISFLLRLQSNID